MRLECEQRQTAVGFFVLSCPHLFPLFALTRTPERGLSDGVVSERRSSNFTFSETSCWDLLPILFPRTSNSEFFILAENGLKPLSSGLETKLAFLMLNSQQAFIMPR